MARPREGNYKVISVNLDPQETDKFVQGLKHSQSLSEVFREYIAQENKRKQSEKNLNAPNYGAIKIQESNFNTTLKDKNLSLDIFNTQTRDLTTKLIQIEDVNMIRQLRNKGHVIETVCSTRIRKLIN